VIIRKSNQDEKEEDVEMIMTILDLEAQLASKWLVTLNVM
jgi:hypothetical protein